MVSRVKLLSCTGLAAVLTLVVPHFARADLEIWLEEDGVPATKIMVASAPDFSPFGASFTGYYGPSGFTAAPGSPVAGKDDFLVNILGGSATNANPTSNLLTSTTKIQNVTGTTPGTTAGIHTLTVFVSETDYTLPGTSGSTLNMDSSIGSTVPVQTGVDNTLLFQSYANNSNLINDTSGTTPGPQSLVLLPPGAFKSSDFTTTFPRTSSMYSVTTTNGVTLDPSNSANYSTSTSLTAIPAPAGLVLALAALPSLGAGSWWSRKRKKTVK